MKLDCHVIEDLLPLYEDHVCSEESRILVEEHIKTCNKCRKILEENQEEIKLENSQVDDTVPMKSIKKRIVKSKLKAALIGVVIALFVFILGAFGYYKLWEWKCLTVPTDVFEITDVSRLADGKIIYHLNVKDGKRIQMWSSYDEEEQAFYIYAKRSIVEGKETVVDVRHDGYRQVDYKEEEAYRGVKITSVYFGQKGDAILLWQEGMELPPATERMERLSK